MALRIRNSDDLAAGIDALIRLDPAISGIVAGLPNVPLRLRPAGFAGLAEIIIGQQVSKASAAAMTERLKRLVVPLDAATVLTCGEPALVQAGLSRVKQASLLSLAETVESGAIDLIGLCEHPVDEALARLVSLRGIGPWTAQVYLLFCAGHGDIFPAGDVALQHALGEIAGCSNKPDAAFCETYAARWSPYRSIASRVLYAHYAQTRSLKQLPV